MKYRDQKINNRRTIKNVLESSRLSRKRFLQYSTSALCVGMAGPVLTGCGADAKPRGRALVFSTLEQVLDELDLIEANRPVTMHQEWSLYKVLEHLAQSLEYSVSGYPTMLPPLVRAGGALLFESYKKQGFMRHDLTSEVLDAPIIDDDGDLDKAFARFRNALALFQNHQGPFPELHFAYGPFTEEDWLLNNTMHIADHFSMLSYEIE